MSRALGFAACLLIAGAAYRASEPIDAVRSAAHALCESLSAEQRAAAVFGFDDAERFDWHFVPRSRKGVALGELDAAQVKLLRTLLRTSLGAEGERKLDGALLLEGVLREVESNPGRDPGNYHVSLFGELEGRGRFGWRFEGHHVALNFADVEGRAELAFTPHFLGANPARVGSGAHDGLRVLADEEDLARKLVRSLDDAQRRKAIPSDAAPADVLMGPSRDELPDAVEGLAFTELTAAQQTALLGLLDVYTRRLASPWAEAERARFAAKSKDLRFVWLGSLEPGKPHYYRIQGPSFAIEYDNVQGGANHVHTVWRDLERDFGDPLREHYERAHK